MFACTICLLLSVDIVFLGGPGLYDPCEKEPTDALARVSAQFKEDITVSAQVRML